VLLIFSEKLVREIKNDIAIAEQKLDDPIVNKLKNDDFLIKQMIDDYGKCHLYLLNNYNYYF